MFFVEEQIAYKTVSLAHSYFTIMHVNDKIKMQKLIYNAIFSAFL